MSRIARLVLVSAALLVPVATHHLVATRATIVRKFDLDQIPARLGSLALEGEEELPADVLEMISPDAHTLRLYRDESGSAAIWAYLAFYSGAGAKGAHDPEVCYPAQGWDIAALRSREVTLADGKSLTGKLLAANLGTQEELVLYWFQPAGRWPQRSPAELALRGIDALAGRSRYAFVRLSTRIGSADPAQQSAAEARLVEAARALAPAVRATVDAS
jgi:EpsI family protein